MRIPRLIALVFALLVAGCGGKRLTPAQVSEQFFAKCGEGKYSEVYESTTIPFRVEKTAKYFEARVRDLRFDQTKSVEWQEPVVKDDVAQRWGDITFKDDGKMTIIVTMHHVAGDWRVHGITYVEGKARDDLFAPRARTKDTVNSTGTAFSEPVTREIPTERLLRKMVEKSFLDFGAAIRAKDFSEFLETVSDRWKYRGQSRKELDEDFANEANRITVPKLNSAFRNFIDSGVDMSDIPKAEMKLSEPARINSDGVLLVNGEFSTAPIPTTFKFEYYFEGGRWKLFGISIHRGLK